MKVEGEQNEGIERQMADKGSQRKRKKFKEKEARTQIERKREERHRKT